MADYVTLAAASGDLARPSAGRSPRRKHFAPAWRRLSPAICRCPCCRHHDRRCATVVQPAAGAAGIVASVADENVVTRRQSGLLRGREHIRDATRPGSLPNFHAPAQPNPVNLTLRCRLHSSPIDWTTTPRRAAPTGSRASIQHSRGPCFGVEHTGNMRYNHRGRTRAGAGGGSALLGGAEHRHGKPT